MELDIRKIEHCSCVYLLVEEKTGKKYVGATADLRNRMKNHLLKGKIVIASLKILQLANRSRLSKLELKWIEKIKPELNDRKTFTHHAGIVRSKSTKRKMSAWQKGIKRGSHSGGPAISRALKGIPKSEAHRLAAAKARKGIGKGIPWSAERRAAFEAKRKIK